MALDKNEDHELSSREIRNATRSLLKLDRDNSNSISAEELAPPEPPEDAGQQGRPPAPKASELMQVLDTDNSGDLSEEELAAAEDSILTLDKDEDGKISFEEAKSLGDPDDESSVSGRNGGPPGGGPPGGGPPPRR